MLPPDKATPEQVFEEIFQFSAALAGFDIQRFDTWLKEVPAGELREQLTARRAKAKTAALSNSQEVLFGHLEWLLLRWQVCERDAYVIPLARTGEKVVKGGKKGQARNSNSKRAQILNCAVGKGPADPEVIRTIAKESGATVRTVRDTLAKAGLYTPRGK